MDKALETALIEIKNNDDRELREALIADYIPFIIKTVSAFTGKYVHVAHSEEYAVALEAFDEAIDRYDLQRGKFVNYAQLVIQSRLKDLLRHRQSIPVVEIERLNGVSGQSDLERETILKQEIQQLVSSMAKYGITFERLEDAMPSHRDTREKAVEVARCIAEDPEAYRQLQKTGRLPRQRIQSHLLVTDKQLKHSRIYIIAVTIVLSENLETIREIVQI